MFFLNGFKNSCIWISIAERLWMKSKVMKLTLCKSQKRLSATSNKDGLLCLNLQRFLSVFSSPAAFLWRTVSVFEDGLNNTQRGRKHVVGHNDCLYFRFPPAATLSPAASIVKLSLFVERIPGPFVYDALPDQFVTLWTPVNLCPNLQAEKKIFFSMDKRQCVSETQLWAGS